MLIALHCQLLSVFNNLCADKYQLSVEKRKSWAKIGIQAITFVIIECLFSKYWCFMLEKKKKTCLLSIYYDFCCIHSKLVIMHIFCQNWQLKSGKSLFLITVILKITKLEYFRYILLIICIYHYIYNITIIDNIILYFFIIFTYL